LPSYRLPPIADPFARPLPDGPATGPARAVRAAPHAPTLPSVRAIVSGERPLALVDDGRSVTIVGIGDMIGARRISAIETEALVLDDGLRLALGDDIRR
jgi:hypothetical protein